MALTNQATISLAVNIKNLAKVESLNKAFNDLRQTIITMQRSTQGVSGMAKAIKAASDAAADNARNQERASNATKEAADVAKRASAQYTAAVRTQSKVRKELAASEKESVRWSEQYDRALVAATGHSRAFTTQLKAQDRAAESLAKNTRRLAQNTGMSKGDWNKSFNAANAAAQREATKAAQMRARTERELARDIAKKERADASAMRAAAAARKVTDQQRSANEALKKSLESLRGRLEYHEQRLDAVFRASFRLQMLGSDLRHFGRQIFDAFGTIMNVFEEFEFNMHRAAGAFSIWNDAADGTTIGVDNLQASILDLAQEMRLFSAAEIAEALYFWGSTTGEVVETQEDLQRQMEAIGPIMKAAAMTNTGYETTIKGVYSILTQYYNGAVDKAAHVTELLFYATQKTAAEFPDLINSFKMVGPVAAANAESFEDMVDLFGRLADLGIRGTMAGRGLRQLFIQAVRPSGPAMEALKEVFNEAKELFGGRTYKETMFEGGQFVGVAKYVQNLALALRDATDAERNFLLARITTANELPILTALVVENIRSLKGLETQTDKTAAASEEASDYFRRNWNRLAESWRGITGILERSIEGLQIIIGDVIAGYLEPIIKRIAEVIQEIRKWADANRDIVTGIAKFISAVAGISVIAGTAASVMGVLIALGASVALVIQAFGRLVPTFTIVLTAVGALGTAIIENFDYIRLKVEEFWKILGGSSVDTASTLAALTDAFNAMFAPAREIFNLLVRGFADLLPHLARLITLVSDLNRMAGGAPLQFLVSAFGLLVAAKTLSGLFRLVLALTGLNRVMGMLKNTMGSTGILGAFSAAQAKAAEAGAGRVSAGIRGIAAAARGLVAALGPITIFFLALEAWNSDLLGIRSTVEKIIDPFRDLTEAVHEATSEFGMLGDQIADLALSTVKVEDFAKAWDKAKQAVGGDPLGPTMSTGVNVTKDNPMPLLDAMNRQNEFLDAEKMGAEAGQRIADWVRNAYIYTNEWLSTNGRDVVTPKEWADTYLGILRSSGFTDPTEAQQKAFAQATVEIKTLPAMSIEALGSYWDALDPVHILKSIPRSRFIAESFRGDAAVQNQIAQDNSKRLMEFYLGAYERIKSMTWHSPEFKKALMNAVLAQTQFEGMDAYELLASDQISQELKDIINTLMLSFGEADIAPDPNVIATLATSLSEAVQQGVISAFEQSKVYQNSAVMIDSISELMSTGQTEDMSEAAEILLDPAITGLGKSLLELAATGELPKQLGDAILGAYTEISDKGINLAILGTKEYWAMKRSNTAHELFDAAPTIDELFDPADYAARMESRKQDYAKAVAIYGLGRSENWQLPEAERAGEEAAEKVWTEWADGFTSAVDATKGFGKSVREALKRGTDMKQFGRLLTVTISDNMEKALSGNIASRSLGIGILDQSVEGIIAAMTAAGPRLQRKMATRLGRFFNKNWDTMPDEAKIRFEPLIRSLLSGEVNIPAGLERELQGKISTKVQGVITRLSSAFETPDAGKNNVFGEIATGLKQLREGTYRPEERTTATQVDIKVKPNIEFADVDPVLIQTAITTTINDAMKNTVSNITVDMTSSGESMGSQLSAGILTGYGQNNITARVGQTLVSVATLGWNATGIGIGTALSGGILAGYGQNNISGRVQQTIGYIAGLAWGSTGITAGAALSSGIIAGYSQNDISGRVRQTLTFIAGLGWRDPYGLTAGSGLSGGIIAGYGQNNITARVQQTLNNIIYLPWVDTGFDAGRQVSAGWIAGYGQNSISGRVSQTLGWINGLGWSSGGSNAGSAWGSAFADRVASYARSAAAAADAVMNGKSPPKEGPLKNVDKGGYNVGKTWGANVSKGARAELHRGMREAEYEMAGRGNFNAEIARNDKRQIDITLNVESADGSVDRGQLTEIRKGLMDALVLADLEHMVTVR